MLTHFDKMAQQAHLLKIECVFLGCLISIANIYEDVLSGKLFHKVPTYKPSSLISVEFDNNGETLLVFLEDKKVLQVYEYKGIEGFKHRASVKQEGSKLISMTLPKNNQNVQMYVIGIVDKSKLTIIYAVMSGNQMHSEEVKCRI